MLHYDGVDISDFPLHKRKALLNHLKFNTAIKNVYSLIVTSKQDLITSAELFCSMSGSEGAVIKEYSSTYTMGGWLKYNRRQHILATIIKVNQQDDSFSFTVGIPISKSTESLRPSHLVSFNELPHLILGITKSTKTQGVPGNLVELEVEEVWKHEWYHNGECEHTRFSIHEPSVLAVNVDNLPSSLEHLDKLAECRGQKIIENMELTLEDSTPGPEGGTMSSQAQEFWANEWHTMYPKDGKGNFIYHLHWEGLEDALNLEHEELLELKKGKVHGDLRFSATQDAFAFTIFEGSINDIPKEEGSKFIAMKQGDKLQAHPKNRMPLEWLDLGCKVLSSSEKLFDRDWGSYVAGTWCENMLELFLNGKDLKGRVLITLSEKCWTVSFPENQKPYAELHSKAFTIFKMKSLGHSHLIWNNPDDSNSPELITL